MAGRSQTGSRCPAWNANTLVGFENYELTAEVIQATKAYKELDADADKPFAWNIELAWFPKQTVQYALRLEYSDELEDQPRWQYGVAATWRPHNNVTLSLEYLHGEYKKDFVQDDDDNSLNSRDWVAAQLSLEF